MHTRHRPSTLINVVGHDEVKRTLTKFVADPNRPHTYIFSGPPGCTKTTFSRILAKELGASEQGIKEIDIRGIDEARKIKEEAQSTSLFSDVKVFIIDEIQLLTRDASDTLLKLVEEPPNNVYFIMCTTEPNKINPALFKRGIHLPLKPLSDEQMLFLLKKVIKAEKALGNEINITKSMAAMLINKANGIPRDLLTGLTTIQTCTSMAEANILLADGIPTETPEVIDIARGIMTTYPTGTFQQVLSSNLEKIKHSPEEFRLSISGYIAKVALSPSNAAFYESFGDILIILGEPTPTKAHYSKLIGILIKAYSTMKQLKEKRANG